MVIKLIYNGGSIFLLVVNNEPSKLIEINECAIKKKIETSPSLVITKCQFTISFSSDYGGSIYISVMNVNLSKIININKCTVIYSFSVKNKDFGYIKSIAIFSKIWLYLMLILQQLNIADLMK